MWSDVIRYGSVLLLVLLTLAGGAVWWIVRSAQQVPVRYQQALDLRIPRPAETARELERRIESLGDRGGAGDRWEAVFTETQVNAWLATQLPERYGQLLPREIADPRVVIDDGEATLYCRYTNAETGFQTVVSIRFAAQLTENPNELAITLKGVSAGALPLPVERYLDQMVERADAKDFRLEWVEDAENPTGLVQIPSQGRGLRRPVAVEALTLAPGELSVAGRFLPGAASSGQVAALLR